MHYQGFFNEATWKEGELKISFMFKQITLEFIFKPKLKEKWQMKIHIRKKQFKNFWTLTSREEISTECFNFAQTMPDI